MTRWFDQPIGRGESLSDHACPACGELSCGCSEEAMQAAIRAEEAEDG